MEGGFQTLVETAPFRHYHRDECSVNGATADFPPTAASEELSTGAKEHSHAGGD